LIIIGSFVSTGACGLGGLNPELYKLKPEDEEDEGGDGGGDSQFGRVWFGLEYDMTSERLLVTVIKAKNLLSRGTSAASSSSTPVCYSPFVRVSLFPEERRTLQSKAKMMTNNPQFDETFGFQVRNWSIPVFKMEEMRSYDFHVFILFHVSVYITVYWS